MLLKLADFNIEIKTLYNYIIKQTKDYTVEDCDADISLTNTQDDIETERKLSEGNFGDGYIESIVTYRKIAEWLPLHNAFLLHSATFDVDGVGVAFAAHSGTGKTTHMRLWQKYLGDKMTVVNGDKPIVRFFENETNIPYVYGTPWNGKERLGTNTHSPLRHICFIERSKTNYVEKIAPKDAVDRIFNQVYMPKNPAAVMNTIRLINQLISSCELWIIHCNMEPEAAKVAYEAIFNSEFGMRNSELNESQSDSVK